MAHDKTVNFARGFNQINPIASAVELEGLEAVTAQPITIEKARNFVYTVGNFAAYALGVAMAPFNMVGDMHAAGNTKNSVRKSELEQSARNNAALALENVIGGAGLNSIFKGINSLRKGATLVSTMESSG